MGLSRKIWVGFHLFLTRTFALMKQPIFIAVTILGNTCILLGTFFLYRVEPGVNPRLHTVLDAIWWAVATVSTVGYGDISPVTQTGKLIGIFMMLIGAALFYTYTALLAGALITSEIGDIEKKIETDEQSIHDAIKNLESAISELQKIKKP